MNQNYYKIVSIRHSFCFWLHLEHKLFMTYPKNFLNIRIYWKLRHKRNSCCFHWMIESCFSWRKNRTIFKSNIFFSIVKERPWLIILFSYPVVVSSLLTNITVKVSFFSSIKAEWLISIKNFINFINSLTFEYCWCNRLKITKFWKFVLNIFFSFIDKTNFLCWQSYNRFPFYFLFITH